MLNLDGPERDSLSENCLQWSIRGYTQNHPLPSFSSTGGNAGEKSSAICATYNLSPQVAEKNYFCCLVKRRLNADGCDLTPLSLQPLRLLFRSLSFSATYAWTPGWSNRSSSRKTQSFQNKCMRLIKVIKVRVIAGWDFNLTRALLPTDEARLLKITTDLMDSKNWFSYFGS